MAELVAVFQFVPPQIEIAQAQKSRNLIMSKVTRYSLKNALDERDINIFCFLLSRFNCELKWKGINQKKMHLSFGSN